METMQVQNSHNTGRFLSNYSTSEEIFCSSHKQDILKTFSQIAEEWTPDQKSLAPDRKLEVITEKLCDRFGELSTQPHLLNDLAKNVFMYPAFVKKNGL